MKPMPTQAKLLMALFLASGIVANAHATTTTVNASVTVNNTINMTVNSPLDLGTISAFADTSAGNSQSTMVLAANPATSPVVTNSAGNSQIVVLTPGTPADISVTGAAPNYALTVTLPGAPVTLTDPAAVSDMAFSLGSFTRYAYLEGNSQTFGTTTNGNGDLSFYVGATLSTTNTGGATAVLDPYDETTYTGTFDVTVEY